MKIQEIISTVSESVHDPHIFKAIFTAGAPGSGKSTIAHKLFAGLGLKDVNVDKFWELYNKLGKHENYPRFHLLTQMQKKNFLAGRLGLIIDGTGRRLDRTKAIKDELDELGYDTAMVFVNTDMETALARVQQRSESTGRTIEDGKVKDFWKATQNNLGQLQSMFGKQFYIVDNTETPDLTFVNSRFKKWLSQKPNKPAATNWIRSQLMRQNVNEAN